MFASGTPTRSRGFMTTVIAVVVALIVGLVSGYAFRGAIHKEIKAAGSTVQTDVNTVTKKL